MNRLQIMALAMVLASAVRTQAAPGQHVITVTLNYDFTADNACGPSVTKGCLQQFNVYDLTGGTAIRLFSIPAPADANALVKGITGSSAAIALKSGTHIFAATAQMADGTESDPNASTATASVKPGAPLSFSVTVQ